MDLSSNHPLQLFYQSVDFAYMHRNLIIEIKSK